MNSRGTRQSRNILPRSANLPHRRNVHLAVAILFACLTAGIAGLWIATERASRFGFRELSRQPAPENLNSLLSLKPEALSTVDIALANLICAQGLPGAEELRADEILNTLDQWALQVDAETKRCFRQFTRNPRDYNILRHTSEFCCL